MTKTALITGISGQDGSYLANFLLKKKYRVLGTASSADPAHLWRLDYFGIRPRVKIMVADRKEKDFISKIIRRSRPDELYNLAGQASVAQSWEDPVETFRSNAVALIETLEAVCRYSPRTRVFQASSAEIYGESKKPFSEKTNVFAPRHPYGASKLAAHFIVKNFREQYGLRASTGILFNHISPLQNETGVAKKIVAGVARIALGLSNKLTLGDLSVRRDWGYAAEYVDAMWRINNHRRADDFLVCTGKTFALREFLRLACAAAGIPARGRHIEIDPALFRKQETLELSGSRAKITRELGWKPRVMLPTLVKLMVDYEFTQLRRAHGHAS